MAKVTLRNSFLQIYKETTDYSYESTLKRDIF